MRMQVVSPLFAVLAASAGCSVVMMERVDHPYGPQHLEEPRCTAIKGWVLLDGATAVGAAVSAVLTTRVALDDDAADYSPQLRAAAVVSAVMAVAYGGSAWFGNRSADRCREARRIKDANVRRAGREP
jgi:hypothetical protein